MVLIPEVHQAIQPYGDVPILAAGGIVTGKQMAAAMAMGASGAWCGSVWLTTIESEVEPVIKEKMVAANSSQTVRSRSRTGKQMAAAMAMGASGAWCGSVWLTTIESEVEPIIKEKMVAANSSQTVRSCLLYTSPSPRDKHRSRMPSSA